MANRTPDSAHQDDDRSVSTESVRGMLASLQEAVVTADAKTRRALLKEVIGRLQEILSPSIRS